jgi:type IV secretory pathway TrbL component
LSRGVRRRRREAGCGGGRRDPRGAVVLLGTAQYAENYLNYLVYLGIPLFVLDLLVLVGSTVLTRMADAIHGAPGSAGTQQTAAAVAAAVIVAGLILRVPANMAGRITTSHSFGLTDALRGHS